MKKTWKVAVAAILGLSVAGTDARAQQSYGVNPYAYQQSTASQQSTLSHQYASGAVGTGVVNRYTQTQQPAIPAAGHSFSPSVTTQTNYSVPTQFGYHQGQAPSYRPYARPASNPAPAYGGGYAAGDCGDGSCGTTTLGIGPPATGACGDTLGTDSCGSIETCAPRVRSWYGYADSVFLRRSHPGSYSLFVDEATLLNETMNVDAFDFDYAFGPRVTLGRRFGCNGCWGIEGSWLDIDGWDETLTVGDGNALRGPGFFAGATALYQPAPPGTVNFQVNYGHDLATADINLVHDVCGWCWFTPLFGFRWLEVNENLNVTETDIPLPNLLDIQTSNQMYGLQTGGYVHFINGCRFKLDGVLKCGFLMNSATQNTSSAFLGPAVTASDYNLGIYGEAGLNLRYQVTCRLALRAGYQVMFIDGVALAPDQIRTTSLGNASSIPPTINAGSVANDGTLFYDGGDAGLEWCW